MMFFAGYMAALPTIGFFWAEAIETPATAIANSPNNTPRYFVASSS